MIGELVDVRGRPLEKATFASQAVATTGLSQMARELGDPNGAPFGPGLPIAPILTAQVEPRIWDYPVGFNIPMAPRTYEPITFAMLLALADNYDVARLAIEKRKDGIRRMRWSIRPKPIPGQTRKEGKARAARLEDAVAGVTGFFLTPDQERQWGAWIGRVLEDLFVIDAPTIWLRPTRGGELYGLEAIDGATIAPKIDAYGRIPLPPEPAYVQVIKGTNREFMTRDELIYAPYWQRTRSPYGSPPLSWVLLTVNRALRRQTLDLANFTDGTMPTAFMKIAKETPASQVKELQEFFDALLAGNDAARARIRFIPGGEGTGLERVNPEPTTEGEQWLMHLTCAALGVSPTELGFLSKGSGLGGKGFAEAQQDAGLAREVGIAVHLKGQLDRIIASDAPYGLGQPELEFFWDDLEKPEDKLAEAQALAVYVDMAATTPDWIAENILDQDPQGVGPILRFGGTAVPLQQFLEPPAPPPAPGGGADPFAALLGPEEGGGSSPSASAEPGELTDEESSGEPVAKASSLDDGWDESDLDDAPEPLEKAGGPKYIFGRLNPAYTTGATTDDISKELAAIRERGRKRFGKVPSEAAVRRTFAKNLRRRLKAAIRARSKRAGKNPTEAEINHTLARAVAGNPKLRALLSERAPIAKASSADVDADLDRWQRKALKAVREGRDPSRFESDAIEPARQVLLRDALAKTSSADDVRGAFELAKAGGSEAPLPGPRSAPSSGPSSRPGSSARGDRWWNGWA